VRRALVAGSAEGDALADGGHDAWVGRIAHGDPAAFEIMVKEFAAPLRRFVFRYTRSREAASELVQDVFYKVWRNRTVGAAFAGRQQVQAYLYRAARNQALDYIARETTRLRWRRESRDHEAGGFTPLHTAPANTHAELAELAATIDQVLAEMPERRREVCVLRWRHGQPVAEIAEQLAISTKTVEVQIGRGLRQLRERIAQAH
jgi:RNA polymerase sigma-70 factor (ECF subfamily)